MFRYFGAVSLLALLTATVPVVAQPTGETPRWIRYAAISPDGETISFTYRGQIFLVPSDGGLAVPITAQGSYSHSAVWSPDSEQLAFASNLNASDDVYLTDFSGTLRRMSWSAQNEAPVSFSPDGASILYSTLGLGDAERSVQCALSNKPQLYAMDTETGRETLLLPNSSVGARWNPAMNKLAYAYDPARDAAIRQHRVASNARQLYIYDPASGYHARLFAVDGVDRLNPVWSADGTTLYYLSEASGTLNVWSNVLGNTTETQLTFFDDAPARDLSIASDDTLAFIHDGRIYTHAAGADQAEPIAIMTLDQRASIDENVRIDSTDQFISSPDGDHFAFTALGNVFISDRQGNYRQITSTPEEERYLDFAPDGSALVYASQRDHQWGLYSVQLLDEDFDDPLSRPIEEQVLYIPEDGNAFQPKYAPDGTRLAFVADRREVQVLDLDTLEVTALFGPEDYNSSYAEGDQWFAWSPTSDDILTMWKTIAATGTVMAAVVPADGSAPPVMVTQALPDFMSGAWSADGSQLLGTTSLFSSRTAQQQAMGDDFYRIFLSEEARQDFLDLAEGLTDLSELGPQRYEPDFLRSERLEGMIGNADGLKHFYPLEDGLNVVAVIDAGDDNYLVQLIDLSSGDASVLQVVEAAGLQSVSHVPGLNILDFKVPNGVISVPVFDPNGTQRLPLNIFTTYNPDHSRQAAFEQVWATVKYHFYSSALEGRDWDGIGAKYRSYLGSVATNREFAELVETMLGELSASHLFSVYTRPEGQTAGLGTHNDVLGVYLDYGYEGPGRRVAAILPGGPLDRSGIDIEPGDVIVSINGQAVPDAGGLERLLDVNLGRRAQIGITDVDGSEMRFAYVRPIDVSEEGVLAGQRWRDTRRELVDRLSNGCVAYQYVAAMDNPSYLGVLGRMTAARQSSPAALIDIRNNGGGNLTRDLMTFLSSTPYSVVGRENGPQDMDPNNRWAGPSALVVNSYVYSDATIFPQAYQDAGVGVIVGDSVLNTGTYRALYSSTLLPGYAFAMPVLPVRRMDGTFYENNVIEPDIAVPFDPNTAGIGVDPQLEAAVAALMEQIGADSVCR